MAFRLIKNIHTKTNSRIYIAGGKIFLHVPRDVWTEIGCSAGDRLDVQFGEGNDLGVICVYRGTQFSLHASNKNGGPKCALKTGFSSRRIPYLSPSAKLTHPCEHWTKGGKLFVRLPDEILVKEAT